MFIGHIVEIGSHGTPICHIHQSQENGHGLAQLDYAFGRFVRIAVRTETTDDEQVILTQNKHDQHTLFAVGVIYTVTMPNSGEGQAEHSSPDGVSEQTVFVSVALLGMMEKRVTVDGGIHIISVKHGSPRLFPELGSTVETMSDEEVWAFHFFSDPGEGAERAYLHLDYIPHLMAKRSMLLLMVIPHIVDQLEPLFPQQRSVLSIVRRHFSWELKD